MGQRSVAGPIERGLEQWSADPSFPLIDRHPFTGQFGRRYYPAVYGERRREVTFAIIEGDRPLLVVPCTVGEGALDWYGLPIRVFTATDLNAAGLERRLGDAMAHLEGLMNTHAVARCLLEDDGASHTLSPLGVACLTRQWKGGISLHGRCDLKGGEEGLRRGLRKRFRSLVNWGRRNVRLTYVNADHPSRDQFDAYRRFHFDVAGRSTRPAASWDAMFDSIVTGGGELTLGHLATGELVAATLVVDGSGIAYYASGVYDRERFDKPMAHYPLYDAILRAGGRGMQVFDLGVLPQPGDATEKEYSIGYFKRGFASCVAVSLIWAKELIQRGDA